MHQKSHNRRILAIALRSGRFGYAVFEESDSLLDWGMVFYPLKNSAQRAAASKRVASLLSQFAPSMVIVQYARSQNVRDGSGVRPSLRSIRRETSARLIPVRVMKSAEVKEAFRPLRATSKHEIASGLTEVFPELLWKLPPKRKIWETEHFRMILFDAVALGFAYWLRYGARDPTEG
jgi:D-alanyl-D-alanine carboxypeptidase